MNRKTMNLSLLLILTISIVLPAHAKTRGNAEGKATIWADITATSSESITSNHITQYYIARAKNHGIF
jgi:hypothetical protein